jgi:DNA repair exonuclease SbcCD ATPase subunit
MQDERIACRTALVTAASERQLSTGYEEEIKNLKSEFRDAGLRLHAAAAENEVLRESLITALQSKQRLEQMLAELERERDAIAKKLEEARHLSEELRQQSEELRQQLGNSAALEAQKDAQIIELIRGHDEAAAHLERLHNELAGVPWRAVGVYKRIRQCVPRALLVTGARVIDDRRAKRER